MELSLSETDLVSYIAKQLDNFYPDGKDIRSSLQQSIGMSLQRLEYCFKHVSSMRYFNGTNTFYNHLYSDHNIVFLWFLSNSVWKETEDGNLASKLYYLNKSLHGFDCMYDTELPDIFLIFHGVGTMLGKASYGDFFVALQGCTIGSHKGGYPVLGKGVSLTANSSVIGNCVIGDRVNVATGVLVFEKSIQNDNTIYRNSATGINEIKKSKLSYAQQFFNVDLK